MPLLNGVPGRLNARTSGDDRNDDRRVDIGFEV